MGIAGRGGTPAASALDADVPASLRKGALGALSGQPNFPREMLTLRKHGVDIPQKVNQAGHFVLRLVACRDRSSRFGGVPRFAPPYFEGACVNRHQNLSNGGSHLPVAEDALYRFEPPETFPACEDVTLWDSSDGCLAYPKKIIAELHANWGHASAQQLQGKLVDSGGDNTHLANWLGEVSEHCQLSRLRQGAARTDSRHVRSPDVH